MFIGLPAISLVAAAELPSAFSAATLSGALASLTGIPDGRACPVPVSTLTFFCSYGTLLQTADRCPSIGRDLPVPLKASKIHKFFRLERYHYEENQDSENPESLRKRQKGRLRRVPDLLPVRLQNQLRRRQPEVRKEVRRPKTPPPGGVFSPPVFRAPI